MAETSIPVDLLNPGQVFACLGFLEAADALLGDAEAAFDWSAPHDTRFVLRAAGDEDPVRRTLRFLGEAKVVAEAPRESANAAVWKTAWGDVTILPEGTPYPGPDPDTPATLRAALQAGADRLVLDHWVDGTRRDPTKFWAGAGGYPGTALARDALALFRAHASHVHSDPFAWSAPQSSSFRFDWRRDYIPLDAGFSLNRHSNIETVGFPLVELLAALGLTNARPKRGRSKLEYRYGVAGRSDVRSPSLLPPSILRAALGGSPLPFPMRTFRMYLGWPGKKGQARAITTVIEEPTQ